MTDCRIEHVRVTGSSHDWRNPFKRAGWFVRWSKRTRHRAFLGLSCALVPTHDTRKSDLGITAQNTCDIQGAAGLISSIWIKYHEKMLRKEPGGME